MRCVYVAALAVLVCPASAQTAPAEDDPYLWLEEVEGEKALAWAAERSEASVERLSAVPEYAPILERVTEIYDSEEKLPGISFMGPYVYNFWQDAEHVRGIWRRTSIESYSTASPEWELVLDLDALSAAEETNWVFKGATCLWPEHRHCLVSLSRGGGDATVEREFDTFAKAFVEDGFTLPEAKSQVDWKDRDTLWVGTDFGEGSLTTSGYPRIAKEWLRGTPVTAADTVFEGRSGDVAAVAYSTYTPEGRYDLVQRVPEFFKGLYYLSLGGRLVALDLPEDADLRGVFQDRFLISLRSPWEVGGETHPADALLAIDVDDFLRGERRFDTLFFPSERVALDGVTATRAGVVVSVLDNVRSRIFRLQPGDDGWTKQEIDLPGLGAAQVTTVSDFDGRFLLSYTDFLTPSGIYLVGEDAKAERLKSSPAWFDAEGMTTAQHEAVSKDGTRIPYFVVMPKGFVADGSAPTVLYGYGGFEISMQPSYSGVSGSSWLERGGVWVLANIRGGGEFGPTWHQAALKGNRQRAFDDFIAVAEDLVERKITSPEHLGIMGGSNGGLLVGATFTQRPDLFRAVVCQVPLLDMKRYHTLLAGASWMAEYGNPDDPTDWEFIRAWSPYQNVKKDAEYPEVFFYTNTRDDRVHPGHARKMVAKMTEMGHPVLYFENTEGGHGAGATNAQRAKMWALTYAYLWERLR
jgi:prolyl oligopeptidase